MRDLAERPNLRWGDLGVRVMSAAILAPVALVAIWLGGIVFTLLVAGVALGLASEWLKLCRLPAAGGVRVALCVGGFCYVAIAGVAILWLRADPLVGFANLLFVILIVWAGDIGAYVIGRWLGGPRLAPRISPGKTWSGALGGLVVAVVVAIVAAHFLVGMGVFWRTALVAACLSLVAQAGDLLESLVKRLLRVKDSSHLIPGHGGLFDRLDGILATVPVAALLALTLGRGVVLWQ